MGCYAQTELAHGSNVQGLMTTARYDPGTDELVVDSNGVEGAKWWIGGAGVLANLALVQAILKVPGPRLGDVEESLGPHLFIVPLRDLEHHLPLPGVSVGDIGPKAYGGFASLDNGYIKFDGVRIPRENMLMRFAQLARGGGYTKAQHDKLSYGSMVALRAAIPENIGWALAKAVTVAVRYCVTRRQFGGGDGEKETQVIHYASVKHRLFPLLAQAYAFILCGREFWGGKYTPLQTALVTRGDTSSLAEVHSLSTALKVLTTTDGAAGMEEARRTMGGHGFSWMSGVGGWWANWTPSQTYEGENYVIAQQTARGLLKHLFKYRQGRGDYTLPQSSEYIKLIGTPAPPVPTHDGCGGDSQAARTYWLNPQHLLPLLSRRAAFLLQQLATAISTHPEKPWTAHSFATHALCRAHAELYLCTTFFSLLLPPPGVPDAVHQLARLYTLYILSGDSARATLLESRALSPENVGEARGVYEWLVMEGLGVSEAVGLVDGFGFRDWEVGVLGGREGGVYEGMWREVVGGERRERGDGREGGKRERVRVEEFGGAEGWEGVRREARRVLGFWKEEGGGRGKGAKL